MAQRSDFDVPRMDCPSEERMIRLALESLEDVRQLRFDLPGRRVSVWHRPGAAPQIAERLGGLGLGAVLRATEEEAAPGPPAEVAGEARTLRLLLGINAVMFAVEASAGFLVESAGLLTDSLDMFADALVYGLGLYAVGRAVSLQLRAARVSGLLQLALALGALAEVVRRFVVGSDPRPAWMLGVATLALAANATCLALVWRHRQGGAHMKASFIFSANDVLANLGVILAGVLVAWSGSRLPDLVVGTAIGLLVLLGAIRILRIRS